MNDENKKTNTDIFYELYRTTVISEMTLNDFMEFGIITKETIASCSNLQELKAKINNNISNIPLECFKKDEAYEELDPENSVHYFIALGFMRRLSKSHGCMVWKRYDHDGTKRYEVFQQNDFYLGLEDTEIQWFSLEYLPSAKRTSVRRRIITNIVNFIKNLICAREYGYLKTFTEKNQFKPISEDDIKVIRLAFSRFENPTESLQKVRDYVLNGNLKDDYKKGKEEIEDGNRLINQNDLYSLTLDNINSKMENSNQEIESLEKKLVARFLNDIINPVEIDYGLFAIKKYGTVIYCDRIVVSNDNFQYKVQERISYSTTNDGLDSSFVIYEELDKNVHDKIFGDTLNPNLYIVWWSEDKLMSSIIDINDLQLELEKAVKK